MKKRIILFAVLTLVFASLFVISISAAATNEFGTVETSTTIDLEGMSTDTKARVVLYDGEEYHTYPSQYIVTDKGDMGYNFDKINTAFEKSYGISSVIRIEIPNTVKVIVSGLFNYGKNNNLKEVYFPSDSQVYKFNWGCFEQNTGIEKINIPASLTEYNGTNHFAKCSSLKEVTFDKGYSVSNIPNNFFQSCSSLEKLVFPNSVTHIGGGAFASCSKLKTIVFGASLQTMNGAMSDCATSGSTWYLPATFYASNVESEPPSNMFHWAGSQTNGVSGTGNNPKNITFVFTGTKDEALALQARFKAADAATGENCVGLSRIYNATVCTEAEYETLTGKKVGEGATGYYIVYGYNECDAFYGSEHNPQEIEGNDCCGLCSRCGNVSLFENPIHKSTWLFAGEDGNKINVSKTIVASYTCEFCKTVEASEDIPTIFLPLGYTENENESGTLGYRASVNLDALDRYEELSNSTVKYGLLAGIALDESGKPLSLDNEGNVKLGTTVVTANMTDTNYAVLEIKVTGINKTTALYCNAYAVVGSDISYICETAGDTATKKSIVIATE